MSEEIPEETLVADVRQVEEHDELDDAEALSSDTLDGDDEDDTWEPDQQLSNATAGLIVDGDRDEETLSERLAQEEPEVDATRGGGADSDAQYRQV